MIIPKKVKIGALWYDIGFIADLPDAEASLSHNQLKLYIEEIAKQGAQELSFWHEVLHAGNGEMAEENLDWLAHFLHAFLNENKLLK